MWRGELLLLPVIHPSCTAPATPRTPWPPALSRRPQHFPRTARSRADGETTPVATVTASRTASTTGNTPEEIKTPPLSVSSFASFLSNQFKSHPRPPIATAQQHPRRRTAHLAARHPSKMQILRLLAARRAARDAGEDDEGPFFDLDFSSCSVRASSYSSGSLSLSDSDSDDECTELDFIISLQRSSSASPLKFCVSEPPARANSLPSKRHGDDRKCAITLRTLSFGARKAAPLYGRHTFPRSSSGRHSFARSSTSSARSFRLFADSPHAAEDGEHHAKEQTCGRAPSRDVIRRCLSKITRRIRTASASPRAAEARGLRRLRKCRSASSAPPASRRDDDSAVEKQDGIAGAIAHCKESLHRIEHAAPVSECDSPLLLLRSDPGECEAAYSCLS